jgi:hypothetical protein
MAKIVVTPAGYDDVYPIVQRLGGLSNVRQLVDADAAELVKRNSLSGVEHLFVNCSDLRLRPEAIENIRTFVQSGGTLYASDWANTVVVDAFGSLVEFSSRDGEAGVIHATVSDPRLAQWIGDPVPITFDLDGWVLITRFPASADVYLMDADRRPLAVGFQVGRGRIVYTSFHHHAQNLGTQSMSENALLEWLTMMPMRHKLLLTTGLGLRQHRVANSTQMMGTAGPERQVMPVPAIDAPGLGVFVLSWDDEDDGLEFSMRYLQSRDSPTAEERSSRSPLVMTVRNPGPDDGIEIRTRATRESGDPSVRDERRPFVLAGGLRRDLLGDPGWFAAAIMRHLLGRLEQETTMDSVRENVTSDCVRDIVRAVLDGLGYASEARNDSGVTAWSPGRSRESPDIAVDAVVSLASGPYEVSLSRPQPAPGVEGVLVVVTVAGGADGSNADAPDVERPTGTWNGRWRIVSTEKLPIGLGQSTKSAQEFLEDRHLVVTVYRHE